MVNDQQSYSTKRVSLASPARLLTLTLLILILVIKTATIWAPSNRVFEIGERPNGALSTKCEIRSPENLEEFASRTDTQGRQCNYYWSIHSNRGFYLHHYASLIDGINSHDLPPIARSIRHQYGIAGRILAEILNIGNLSATPQQYATASLWIGMAGILLLGRVPVKLGLDLESTYTAFIGLCSLALGSLSINQFLLSPGFTPIRIIPILGAIISISIISTRGATTITINQHTRHINGLVLLTASCLTMSIQFVTMTVIAIMLSWSWRFLSDKRINQLHRDHKSPIRQSSAKELFPPLIVAGVCLAAMCILYASSIDTVGGSASDNELHKKPFLFISILTTSCLMFFGTRRLWQNDKKKRGLLKVFGEPVTYQIILFGTYPALYWGSPNHFYLFMLVAAYPLAVLISNIQSGNSIIPSKLEILAMRRLTNCAQSLAFSFKNKILHFRCNQNFATIERIRGRKAIKDLQLLQILRNNIQIYWPRAIYLLLPGLSVLATLYLYLPGLARGLREDFTSLSDRHERPAYLFKECNKILKLGIFRIESCNANKSTKFDGLETFTKNHIDRDASGKLIASDLGLFAHNYDFKGTEYGFPPNKQAITSNADEKKMIKASLERFDICLQRIRKSDSSVTSLSTSDREDCRKIPLEYANKLKKYLMTDLDFENIGYKIVQTDSNLDSEIRQLYIVLYKRWLEEGRDFDSDNVKETLSKLARYIWRDGLRDSLESSNVWIKQSRK